MKWIRRKKKNKLSAVIFVIGHDSKELNKEIKNHITEYQTESYELVAFHWSVNDGKIVIELNFEKEK